ncbi:DNA helicase [Tanacetum coccineum]
MLHCDPQLQMSGTRAAMYGQQGMQLASKRNVKRVQQPFALVSISSAVALFDIGSNLQVIWEPANGAASLDRHPGCSGPPSKYKYIGSCDYSCHHCGALSWEDGYSKDLKLNGGIGSSAAEKHVSMKAYYANEYLSGIYDDITRGDNDGSDCGARLILSQSFIDGPRTGILEDDQEWEITLHEAALTATPTELQMLFVHILTFCQASDPDRLWKRTWKSMSNDIPYTSSISLNIQNLHIDESELKDYVLYELESCLNHCSKSLTGFGHRLPPEHLMSVLINKLLMEEKSYDRQLIAKEKDRLLAKLNNKQRHIFDLILDACINNKQELVFVYGHSGTGKPYLWKTIIYALHSEGRIVLAVVSSGIASLLLPAGRTAYLHFKLPLDLTNTSVCSIKKNTQ